jgi:hypothetical protein
MDTTPSKNWQELCKAAATELDPVRLMDLISQIIEALDARETRVSAQKTSGLDDDTAELSCGVIGRINPIA